MTAHPDTILPVGDSDIVSGRDAITQPIAWRFVQGNIPELRDYW